MIEALFQDVDLRRLSARKHVGTGKELLSRWYDNVNDYIVHPVAHRCRRRFCHPVTCYLSNKLKQNALILAIRVTTQHLGSILEVKPLRQGQKTRILGRQSQSCSCSHLYSTLPAPSQSVVEHNVSTTGPWYHLLHVTPR
jgi:hypothetical protein